MRSGLRLLLQWVVLIVLFVAFYAFFRKPGDPPPDLSGWVPVILVVVAGFVGKRHQKGWNLMLNRARQAA